MNNDLLTHPVSGCEVLCRSTDFTMYDKRSICSSTPKIENGIYKSILFQPPNIFAYYLFTGKLSKHVFLVSIKYLSASSAILF